MIRAYTYLAFAGLVWGIEGFLFSYYLAFAAWQIALLGVIYLILFVVAVRRLLTALRLPPLSPQGVAAWRLVTIAPMLVVIVGSFVSLPLVVTVAALGKL